MPNVFGFKENKSKAQVLDKATYDPAGLAGQVALFSQIIPVEINDNITASPIESTTYIMKADSKTITLSNNVSAGLKIAVVAVYATTVSYLGINGNMSDSVLAGDVVSYVFNGTYWLVDNTTGEPMFTAEEQQRPPIGVPTMWFGKTMPTWALDFGNGAATKYLWSTYPELRDCVIFKDMLDSFKATGGSGLCNDYDNEGFYVPDLRGMTPKVIGANHAYNHDAISSVGGIISERIPNVKGSYQFSRTQSTGAPQSSATSGAMGYISYESDYYSASAGTGPGYYGISFSADSYNDIYKENAHVTPLGVGFKWIVRFE